MGRNWQRLKLWPKLTTCGLYVPASLPSPVGTVSHCSQAGVPSLINHWLPLQAQEWGWRGQMEANVDGPLSPLAVCHHPDTALLAEGMSLSFLHDGWPSSEPSQARCKTCAMLSWLLSHFPWAVTSVSPRGKSSTSCICMSSAGALPHLSILQYLQI